MGRADAPLVGTVDRCCRNPRPRSTAMTSPRNLSWDLSHLHAMLREETSEGCNSRFTAVCRLGRPSAFLDDVCQAADLVTSPGLRSRYALVLASLNTLASNLPASLLVALVREKVWPV